MSLYEALKDVTDQEKAALAAETEGAEHEQSTDDSRHEDNRAAKDAGSSGRDKPEGTRTDTGKSKDTPQSHNKAPAEGEGDSGRDTKGRFKKSEEKPEGADKGGKEGSGEKKEGQGGAEGKEELTPDAMAKLRRELAAERRRREAAEARLPQAPTQPGPAQARPAAQKDPLGEEPNPNTDPEAHTRWKLAKAEQQLQELAEWKESQERQASRTVAEKRAIEAYEKYENDFSPTVPDYQEVTTWGVNQIASSIRVLRPDLKGPQLSEAIRFEVLRRAAQYERDGYDPAEQFYHDCKAWGYKPQEKPPADKAAGGEKPAAAEKPPRPSVKEVGKNQRRSAHSMTPGGRPGTAPVTRQAAMSGEMTLADWSRLSPTMLRELEAQEG